MRKFKLSVVLLVLAMSVVAFGSAALSSIAFERDVTAGSVLVDTDPNVAIQITNNSSYSNLVVTEADGKISLKLNEAINNASINGFNTDALYSIGTYSSGVIKIKNNSDIPVTVTLTNAAGNPGALTLLPSNDPSPTIPVGGFRDFYFTLDTNGQDAVKVLDAILRIEGSN